GRVELLAIDAMHWMQAAGLQPTLRIDVLSEREKRLISKGKQRTPQGGKDPEFVVWPFDGNQRIAQRDQLFTIMKRNAAHKHVGGASALKSADIGTRDVSGEASEPAKEDADVARLYRDFFFILLNGPAALVRQPVDECAHGLGLRFFDSPIGDFSVVCVR